MTQLVPHDFDPLTKYCRRCGCAAEDFFNGSRRYCDQVGNVVGVSHVICKKALEDGGMFDLFEHDEISRAVSLGPEPRLRKIPTPAEIIVGLRKVVDQAEQGV